MRVAYFTAGTTGIGHRMRGVAIARALKRAGARAELASFASFAPATELRVVRGDGEYSVAIDADELADPNRAPQSELACALRAYVPDLLLVDLFWAPLRHILPLAGCEAWLLVRSVPPSWFVGAPSLRFDPSAFARVIAIEPIHHDATTDVLDPIVGVNPDELLAPDALRTRLGVSPSETLTVVSQVGVRDEWRLLAARVAGARAHLFTAHEGVAAALPPQITVHQDADFFPLARWLAGADAIVSGAGYNAYWESRWLGFDDRATFVPFERAIDDQAWRISACEGVKPRSNGADTLVAWMERG